MVERVMAEDLVVPPRSDVFIVIVDTIDNGRRNRVTQTGWVIRDSRT